MYREENKKEDVLPPNKDILAQLKGIPSLKPHLKKLMQFVQHIKVRTKRDYVVVVLVMLFVLVLVLVLFFRVLIYLYFFFYFFSSFFKQILFYIFVGASVT